MASFSVLSQTGFSSVTLLVSTQNNDRKPTGRRPVPVPPELARYAIHSNERAAGVNDILQARNRADCYANTSAADRYNESSGNCDWRGFCRGR